MKDGRKCFDWRRGRYWIAFLAAGCLVGCGGAGTPVTEAAEATLAVEDEITIMHEDVRNKGFQEFIREAGEELHLKINIVECPINADSRHAKISSLLSSGDSSVDIISINDEMISEFKYAGYLEPLENDVMKAETVSCFPQDYMEQMIMADGHIYSVPYMMDILVMWVNDSYLSELELTDVSERENFEAFLAHDWGEGRYAYGGAWEKTYVYNEIGEFINLFGGDYYDWSDPKTREAVAFLKECTDKGYSPKDQLLDQYEQMNQKFMNGTYGIIIMYSGNMSTFVNAGVYGQDQIHLTPLPDFGGNTTYIATWQYALNKASAHKDAAKRFMAYAAGREGSIRYANAMNRIPARADVVLEEHLNVAGYEEIKAYLENTQLQARPLPEKSIDYISKVGMLFQQYVTAKLELEEYCEQMQKLVDEVF